MLDELIRLDRALASSWERYLKVLQDPELSPEQAAHFLDGLSAQPDEYLGYTNTMYPYVKAAWLLRLGHDSKALATFIKSRLYECRRYPPKELLQALETSPHAAEYMKKMAAQGQAIKLATRGESLLGLPLTWLERGPVPLKKMWDVCKPKATRKSLFKNDDAYLFRCFTMSHAEKWAASPELFESSPKLKDSKDKYNNDAYSLEEYSAYPKPFHSPHINYFLNSQTAASFDIELLLQRLASERGGDFPFAIGCSSNVLYSQELNVNYCSNGDTVYLLYILKKCGYLEQIFSVFPRLPEDFPLLLMCFAERGIRQRVEEYMGLPGLADVFDLAFAPRHLNVKEQLKLITYGQKNPRFQRLLAASMSRYGYHLYNQYMPKPDWYVQDFAHFSHAHCCDVMLFLASAPDLQPQVRLLLEYGPGTGFAFAGAAYNGFTDGFVFFYRNILAYLAMTGDSRLSAWRKAELDKTENAHNAGRHRRIKTAELVLALQKEGKKSRL